MFFSLTPVHRSATNMNSTAAIRPHQTSVRSINRTVRLHSNDYGRPKPLVITERERPVGNAECNLVLEQIARLSIASMQLRRGHQRGLPSFNACRPVVDGCTSWKHSGFFPRNLILNPLFRPAKSHENEVGKNVIELNETKSNRWFENVPV